MTIAKRTGRFVASLIILVIVFGVLCCFFPFREALRLLGKWGGIGLAITAALLFAYAVYCAYQLNKIEPYD